MIELKSACLGAIFFGLIILTLFACLQLLLLSAQIV